MKALSPYAAPDPPEEKPPLLSWKFWALIFGALKVWKYTPEKWAIWHLSSYCTYATIFGVFKPIGAFISTKLPWFFPMVKACWVKVVAVVVATAKLIGEAFFHTAG